MTAIIITSDLWKGVNIRSHTNIKHAFTEWLTLPEVALDPEKIMIIAGNIAFNRTEQTISFFKTLSGILNEHSIKGLTALWVRGNRDYWIKPQQSFFEMIKKSDKDIMNTRGTNFIHLTGDKPYISRSGILIAGFDGWYSRLEPTNPDLYRLPAKIENMKAHEYLYKKTQMDFTKCLMNLNAIPHDANIRHRIMVSHFPYEPTVLDKENPGYLCTHEHLEEMKKNIDAWVFGHTQKYCHKEVDGITYLNAGYTIDNPHAIILKL